MGRTKGAKGRRTIEIESNLLEIITEHHPMTVRQAYYQLVSKQIIENKQASYDMISRILVNMRKEESIPWEYIEDRNRIPRTISMWNSLKEFGLSVNNAYRKNVWEDQPEYIECWLEKEALSGIFVDVLYPYGVTLNVGKGFDGWSSIQQATERYKEIDKPVTVLYFGDFDPSGEDMERSLKDRIEYFGTSPNLYRCAIMEEDIEEYNLPPNKLKKTDTRTKAFRKKHGDISVELDALPIEVLQNRIIENVENVMDIELFERTIKEQKQEKIKLKKIIEKMNN